MARLLTVMGSILALGVAAAPAGAAGTCTDSWLGGDGNWFDSTNWSAGEVPGPGDDACITVPGSYTVTVPGDQPWHAGANTLQLGASSGMQTVAITVADSCGASSGASELEIFDAGGAGDAALVGPNGRIDLTQAPSTCSTSGGSSLVVDSGTLVNTGSIATDRGGSSSVGGRAVTGSVRNAGGRFTVGAPTTWTGARFDNAGGTVTVGAPTTLAGTAFDNAGALAFTAKSQLVVRAQTGATFINDMGGAISGQAPGADVLVQSGNTFQEGAGTVAPVSSRPGANPGVIVDGGTLAYTANAASSIEVEGNATLVGDVPANAQLAIGCAASGPVLRASSFTNAGFIGLYAASDGDCSNHRTLSLDSAAGPGTGTLTDIGRIEGYGTIAGNLRNPSGSILPGDSLGGCHPVCSAAYSAGLITVGGSYTQGTAGSLRVVNPACSCGVIVTPPRSTPYSQLSVQGNASLDGTLEMITPVRGTPSAGDSLRVLTAGSVRGRFASLEGQLDPSSTANRYVPVYSPAAVTIDVVLFPKLTVTMTGGGSGVVRSSPSGINCGFVCSGQFSNAQSVTLTATPAPGSRFAGWSGSGCVGTRPCRVTVIGDESSVTARFTLVTPPKCKLSFASPPLRAAAHGHRRSRRLGTLIAARIACDQPARLKLSETASAWLGWKHKPHARRWQLRRFFRARSSQAMTVAVPLSAGAERALAKGRVLTIRLTLAATDSAGTSHTSAGGLQLVASSRVPTHRG